MKGLEVMFHTGHKDLINDHVHGSILCSFIHVLYIGASKYSGSDTCIYIYTVWC